MLFVIANQEDHLSLVLPTQLEVQSAVKHIVGFTLMLVLKLEWPVQRYIYVMTKIISILCPLLLLYS